jgi:hypothetical protein
LSAALSPARQKQPEIKLLIQAAESGDAAIVEAQLAAGADVNSATESGMTPLMSAAAHGHLRIVSLLLERGAHINEKRNDELTALALAAFFGHQTVVRELLCHGADIEAKSRFGTSPEVWARTRGFTTITELLKDACSEKAIHGSGNPDESEQVHTGACKSAGTKEAEAATQTNQLLSSDTECFEVSDTTLEVSPANVWLLDYDDCGSGKPIETIPASMRDEAIPLVVGESALINAGGPGSAAEETSPLTDSAHTQAGGCHHDIPSAKPSPLILFLTKITSDRRRLMLATLVVMFVCGIATAFFLEITDARNIPQVHPLANSAVTLSKESTTFPPSTSTMEASSEPFSGPGVENRTKNDERAATRLPATATLSRVPSSEKKDRRNSREIFAKVQEIKNRPARTDSSESADITARKPSVKSALVSAKTERGAQAEEFEPAPLNVEARRPRSVTPKRDFPTSASDSGSGITSGSGHPKAKVIQWP